MKTIAWAVTSQDNLLGDPGITVIRYSLDGGVSAEYDIDAIPDTAECGCLDEDHADAILRQHGFLRITPWVASKGSQWAADVMDIG